MKKQSDIIIIALLLLVIVSFVTTQLTNDFFVFWAYGRFVSNSHISGIGSLVDVWEMKGLLFKIIIALEYSVTSLFSTDFSLFGQFVYKVAGLIAFIPLLSLSIIALPKEFLGGKVSKTEAFCYSGILLFAVHFCSHFQAEMWGVMMLLLAFSLFLRGGITNTIIAGVIYSLTFYLKSPIPLLGGSLFFGTMLLKKQSFKKAVIEIVPFAITTIIVLSGSLLLIKLYLPQEFYDIWNASHFQHTLFNTNNSILFWSIPRLIYNLLLSLLYHPAVLAGSLAAVCLLFRWFKNKEFSSVVFIFGVWLFPLVYILLSNCYFAYHYYLLIYSSIITLLVFINSDIAIRKSKISIFCGIVFVFYILELSSVSPINIQEKAFYTETWEKNKESDNSYYIGCKLGNNAVLFLDDGTGAFVFDNPSYLRYFYPLPLERISEKDAFAQTDAYKDIKKTAFAYSGEYVVLSDWFLNGYNKDLVEKIEIEYSKSDEVVLPKFSWSLNPFADDKKLTSVLRIYKRKSNL